MLKREFCKRCHERMQMNTSVSLPVDGYWHDGGLVWCPPTIDGFNMPGRWINTLGEVPVECVYRLEQLVC